MQHALSVASLIGWHGSAESNTSKKIVASPLLVLPRRLSSCSSLCSVQIYAASEEPQPHQTCGKVTPRCAVEGRPPYTLYSKEKLYLSKLFSVMPVNGGEKQPKLR
jgi:hypothetical protein